MMTDHHLATAFEGPGQRAAAAVALESIDESPTDVERLHRGNRKQTAVVRFPHRGPVVVQVCSERTWLRTEARLLERIRAETDVPVPPVLTAGVHDGVAYMLTAYVAGADLHREYAFLDPDVRRELARSFGRSLATLHDTFQFEGAGPLIVVDETLTAQGDKQSDWLTEYGREAIGRLPSDFDDLRPALEAHFTDGSPPASPPARLYPWDFRPGNALVADSELTAILDWEAPLAAPAPLSVAKAEYLVADWYVDDPEPLRSAFRSGYAAVSSYPEIPTAHRIAAIADSAVDSSGVVTNPRYPELDREGAVSFHRRALETVLTADHQ